MIRLSQDKIEEQAKSFVKNWIQLLSQGKFVEALSQIDEPNTYGIRWTRAALLKVISDYCGKSEFKIDDPFLLLGESRSSLVSFKDGSGYSFDYDLPLNGKWSDLTLQFEFQKRSEDYAVILHDVHVL
jgi:hypothetical protein